MNSIPTGVPKNQNMIQFEQIQNSMPHVNSNTLTLNKEEIYAKSGARVRNFMLTTSIAPTVSGSIPVMDENHMDNEMEILYAAIYQVNNMVNEDLAPSYPIEFDEPSIDIEECLNTLNEFCLKEMNDAVKWHHNAGH